MQDCGVPLPKPAWRIDVVGLFSSYIQRLVITFLAGTLAVFVAIELSFPGGFRGLLIPFDEPAGGRESALIDEYHLDDNVVVRWLHWLADIVTWDWGTSTRNGQPVADLIWPRIPISIELMLAAVALMVLVGIPLGLLSAVRGRPRTSGTLNVLFGLAQSVPVFITPIAFVWIFSVQLRWLPASGWVRISNSVADNLEHLLLPVTALVFAEVGAVARIVRADALRVMTTDYYATAIGKGLGTWYTMTRHVLRPASLGLLNVVGFNIGALLAGSMIVEIVFGIGGLGQLFVESSINRDLPALLALTSYVVVVQVTLAALVDVAMHAVDPRIHARSVKPRRTRLRRSEPAYQPRHARV